MTMMNESHILTLNFDCLERILKLLDLESLCSVAETCKQLRDDAGIVFKNSKFAKSKYRLNEEIPSTIQGYKWQRILRNFGHLIQSLYLVDGFIKITALILVKFQQKMPLIKEITFNNCRSHSDIQKILSFCPNVERLELISSSLSSVCKVLVKLSGKLEELLFSEERRTLSSEFIDILCNFKRLKTLQLSLDTKDMTFLLNNLAAKDVPIENLHLPCDLDDDLTDSICKFKIQKLEYDDCRKCNKHLLIKLVQRLPHLTELVVYCDDGLGLDLLQKILPLSENLAYFKLPEKHKKFEINTSDYESMVKIVQRRCSGVKLKIFAEFPINVHPDSLRQHSKYLEIQKNEFFEDSWYL